MRTLGERPPLILGLLVALAAGLAALYGAGGRAHDLAEARLFEAVVQTVERDYVDPARIDPRRMLESAMESVARAVPEVLVDVGDGDRGDKVVLTVGTRRASFPASEITTSPDSLDELPGVMRKILGYLQKWVRDEVDLKDVEYAAINGMLSTLDPHSVYLNPELYKEMQISTSGNFGGLGIVITVREGHLTIISPLEGTPAFRLGLKAKDRIVAIGDESTINMPLTEAVQRLRGEPGTPVTIAVLRKGWNEPREFTIVRAVIQIESVKSKLLDGGVGLIKVTNFQGNTASDMKSALARFRAESGGRLRGLVLDLRNNPGGLLRQAIAVADLFLAEGVIVSRVGPGGQPAGESRARSRHTETGYPIVVLVNGGSASASEIVAGALKNHGRGLVVGERTFGKGTVQVLYDARRQLFVDDVSALKMTVEKYLTPGGVSIQKVGITPDVQLIAEYVDAENGVDLEPGRSRRREENLDEALADREHEAQQEEPSLEIRFLAPSEDEEEELSSSRTQALEVDFAIEAAQRLLAASRSGARRSELLQQAPRVWRPVIAAERRKVEQALAALGVDWSAGSRAGHARLDASIAVGTAEETPSDASGDKAAPSAAPGPRCTLDPARPTGQVVAGDTACVVVTAKNRGPATVHRLHGFGECEKCPASVFDQIEFVLGRIDPGQSKSWSVPVTLPKDLPSQIQQVQVTFEEVAGRVPEPVRTSVEVLSLPRPAFAYSYRLVDEAPNGNGDGLVQVGETVTLRLTVTNQGQGPALETLATVENRAGSDLFLRRGRVTLSEPLPVGASHDFEFTFQAQGRAEADDRPLELVIRDVVLRDYIVERLAFRLREPTAAQVRPREGWVETTTEASLLSGAAPDAREVARALKGSRLKLLGEIGPYFKVAIGEDGEAAFLAATEAQPAAAPTSASATGAVVRSQSRRPPEILIEGVERPVVVSSDHYQLRGRARDDTELKDVYIFAGARKVFFAAVDPLQGGAPELPFAVDVPLEEGENLITVVARERDEFSSRRFLVVRRNPAPSEAKTGR